MINIYSSREAKEIGENIGRSFLRLRHSFIHSFQRCNCNLEKCIHLFIIILMTILLFEMLVYIVLSICLFG